MIPARYKHLQYNDITPNCDNQVELIKIMTDVIFTKQHNKSLLLYGSVGTGKTLICSGFFNSYKNQCTDDCLFTNLQAVIESVISPFDSPIHKPVSYYADYKLLIIDEINSYKLTDNQKRIINNIVVSRWDNDYRSVYISNLTIENLRTIFDERSVSRLNTGVIFSLTGKDLRKTR